MAELLLKEEVYKIVGAAMEVYNVLGPGFLEAVYQEALEIELADRGTPSSRKKICGLSSRGAPSKRCTRPIFSCSAR